MKVLLAMRANVEDRGIKGDCTPLMEAASGGYVDIVRLLIAHGADVNAQSTAGMCFTIIILCFGSCDALWGKRVNVIFQVIRLYITRHVVVMMML